MTDVFMIIDILNSFDPFYPIRTVMMNVSAHSFRKDVFVSRDSKKRIIENLIRIKFSTHFKY